MKVVQFLTSYTVLVPYLDHLPVDEGSHATISS